MSNDVIYTEPVSERADTAISAGDQETDWSGWERWMRGHLDIERETILEAVVEAVGELEAKRDRQIRELELKIAECSGAVRVLRTGKSLRVRGTFSENAKQLDIVAVGGSSFVAREDNPGQCPGEGWQLLASAGRRGARGFTGPKGERGKVGESAAAGPGFVKPEPQGLDLGRISNWVRAAEKANHRHRRLLLCACCERPRNRCLAEQFIRSPRRRGRAASAALRGRAPGQ
jgi:hypothetical protein